MRTARCALYALLLAALPFGSRADGVYIPKVQLDPRSHARDITEPTQKAVLVHFDGKERLILQVSYKGNVREFAWLVPTPSRPEVSKPDWPVFHELSEITAPRVRYWLNAHELLSKGVMMHRGGEHEPVSIPKVDVLERKQIGFYDIAVLRARRTDDLVAWLHTNQYAVTPKIVGVLADYIRRGWVFTAARIRTGEESRAGARLAEGVLQSIQLDFACAEPVYPLKVSSLNRGRTRLLLYAISPHRLQAAPLETACAFRDRELRADRYVLFEMADGMADLRKIFRTPVFLTKLRGELGPSQMKSDLALAPAPSDESVADYVAAPILENLGVSLVFLVSYPFIPPWSLLTLFICIVVGCTPFGRKHPTLVTVTALAALFGLFALMFLVNVLDSTGFLPVGIVGLVLSCAAVAFAVRAVVRRGRNAARVA